MTMPDSPITDAITDAFARFDATPRDLPEDATELAKRIHFNPHLHPRLPDGRFAPKAGGGRTLGSDPSPSKVTTPPPNVEGVKQRLAAEHGITTPEQLTTALALDNEHGQKIRDLVMGAGVEAPKPKRDWGYKEGERVKVVGKPPSGASGHGDVLSWTGRKDIFRVQLDSGDVVDLPMEHLTAADKRNDTRQIVRDQKTRHAALGQELKDEEGNAIGNPDDWSPGNRVVLDDGSYIGRDDQYPNALFIDEPGANMNYDVSPEDIFDFARTKQRPHV